MFAARGFIIAPSTYISRIAKTIGFPSRLTLGKSYPSAWAGIVTMCYSNLSPSANSLRASLARAVLPLQSIYRMRPFIPFFACLAPICSQARTGRVFHLVASHFSYSTLLSIYTRIMIRSHTFERVSSSFLAPFKRRLQHDWKLS